MNKSVAPLLAVSVWTFLLAPFAPLWASDRVFITDNIPPKIDHKQITNVIADGTPLEITAMITDDEAIREGLLFYRSARGSEFVQVKMEAMGNGLYRSIIPAEDIAPDFTLAYYIGAIDNAGNATVQGLLSQPMIITVKAIPPPPVKEIVPEPIVVVPEKIIVAPEPVVVVPEETIVVPEPVVVVPEETIVVPEPVVVVPEETIVVPEPVAIDTHVFTELPLKEETKPAPFYKKGWFWGLVAIVVGGIILVGTDDDHDGPNTGSLVVEIPVP